MFNLVLAGRQLAGKNTGNKSDPYCEVVVLDDQGLVCGALHIVVYTEHPTGNKLGKSQCTKVIKDSLSPNWSQLLEL